MKKFLIFVFALIMALSLVACQNEVCTEHKDENSDGICDVCETEIPVEHTVHKDENTDGLCDECKAIFINYESPTVVGTLLKNSVEKQFTEAKSFKVDIDFSFIYSQKYSYMEENTAVREDEYMEGIADIDIWVTEGEKYDNAKITVTLKDREDPEAEFNVDNIGTLYIIDGFVYEPAIDGTFIKSELVPAEVQEILDQLSEIELFTEEEKNELLTSLSLEIATVFNIKDNAGSLTIDAKPHVDSLIAYVAALNMQEDTVRKVVDDALKLASPELTAAALLTELDRIAALTVNEALVELDAWLTTNYNTTVQDIYDSLVNDPQVMAFVEQILIENGEIDVTDPEQKAELDAFIANIKALKIADLIANQGIGEVPLYDIIASIASSEESSDGEPTYVTREVFFARINSFLNMTLAEFEEELNTPIFSTVKHYAAGLAVNKLYGRVDLNFENILVLKSIDGIIEADISYSEPSTVFGETNVMSVAGKLTFKISNISNQPLQIVIPENSTLIDSNKIDAYYYDDGSSLWISDYYVIEGKAYVDIDYHTYNSEYSGTIEIRAKKVPVLELINDVITVSEFTATFNGTIVEAKEGSALKLSIDTENSDFTVVQLPEGILPPDILHAFTKFAENQTTTWNDYTLDSSMSQIMNYSDIYEIIFASGTGLKSVSVTVEYDTETDRLVCTITGFTVDSDHLVYRIDKSTSWYGGEYDLDNINIYFGGDTTFEIYIDAETNTIKCDSIPNIIEEYRANWPTEESNQ